MSSRGKLVFSLSEYMYSRVGGLSLLASWSTAPRIIFGLSAGRLDWTNCPYKSIEPSLKQFDPTILKGLLLVLGEMHMGTPLKPAWPPLLGSLGDLWSYGKETYSGCQHVDGRSSFYVR